MSSPPQIVVIRYDTAQKKWIVDPGEVHAAPGEVITWRAEGTVAQIWFPQVGLMTRSQMMLNEDQQDSLIVAPAAGDGTRPYAVFCEAGNGFAQKSDGSEPVVIIP